MHAMTTRSISTCQWHQDQSATTTPAPSWPLPTTHLHYLMTPSQTETSLSSVCTVHCAAVCSQAQPQPTSCSNCDYHQLTYLALATQSDSTGLILLWSHIQLGPDFSMLQTSNFQSAMQQQVMQSVQSTVAVQPALTDRQTQHTLITDMHVPRLALI